MFNFTNQKPDRGQIFECLFKNWPKIPQICLNMTPMSGFWLTFRMYGFLNVRWENLNSGDILARRILNLDNLVFCNRMPIPWNYSIIWCGLWVICAFLVRFLSNGSRSGSLYLVFEYYDAFLPFENRTNCPVLWCHPKIVTFDHQTHLWHLNTVLVRYSDPHCIHRVQGNNF